MMIVITTVVAAMGIASVTAVLLVMERQFAPVRVVAETVVAVGVDAPIRMAAFPCVESRRPRPIQGQPHIAGAEIIIL